MQQQPQPSFLEPLLCQIAAGGYISLRLRTPLSRAVGLDHAKNAAGWQLQSLVLPRFMNADVCDRTNTRQTAAQLPRGARVSMSSGRPLAFIPGPRPLTVSAGILWTLAQLNTPSGESGPVKPSQMPPPR
ncbi:hypothetical protein CDD83_5134 [Cordyceps sp. RAO-2017]|nr:hypothetical protein CDD83_5134 [Cordyceps sp. RAO-2017]